MGDWVWLKLQAYRQHSVQKRSNQKLAHQFYGPFQVIDAVGPVAYKLQLPSDSQIHNGFHVSQLKAFKGDLPAIAHIPSWLHGHNVAVQLEPFAILDKRIVKSKNVAQVQYLVQWMGSSPQEATWEVAIDFEAHFPLFLVP